MLINNSLQNCFYPLKIILQNFTASFSKILTCNSAFKVIIILAAVIFPYKNTYSHTIDLNKKDISIRWGFSEEIVQHPELADNWVTIEGSPTGKRSIILSQTKGFSQNRKFSFRLKPEKVSHYTLMTKFILTGDFLKNNESPALYIASIGNNYEIYLNGNRIINEMFITSDGYSYKHKWRRGLFLPINSQHLKIGENVIIYHIAGEKHSDSHGLIIQEPYIFGNLNKILENRSELFPLILMFLYFFVGLYHIFLFTIRRSERYNLYFGLFSVGVFIYLFSRTNLIYSFIDNSLIIKRLEFSVLYMIVVFIMMFHDTFTINKIRKFTYITAVFSFVISFLTLFMPLIFMENILYIWQMLVIIPICGVLYYSFYDLHLNYKHLRNKYPEYSRRKAVTANFLTTKSGNISLAIIILAITTILDIVDARWFNFDIILTTYGFFIFVMGMALVLIRNLMQAFNEINVLNATLKCNIENLKTANTKISISEEKYRKIVEDSEDAIFTMNLFGVITAYNNSMKKLIGAANIKTIELDFRSLIFDGAGERGLQITIFDENFNECKSTKKIQLLKLPIITTNLQEPIDYNMKMEYISSNESGEILTKLSTMNTDPLLKFFAAEEQTYVINNSFLIGEEITQRITRNLSKYLSKDEIYMMKLGIREMIFNSIEHGNLDISFDEKTHLIDDNKYFEFLKTRQQIDPYKNREVSITYNINSSECKFVIEDQGSGFNYKKFTDKKDSDESLDDLLAHGRGIAMTKNAFDKISYNDKGNIVTLVKNILPK